MATSRNNSLTAGLSGMIGDTIVFKQVNGKTILTNRPRKPRNESELQRVNRQHFREATTFARCAMRNPAKKEYFRKKARKLKLPNAYTAAITAYLRNQKSNDARPVYPDNYRDGWHMLLKRMQCLFWAVSGFYLLACSRISARKKILHPCLPKRLA